MPSLDTGKEKVVGRGKWVGTCRSYAMGENGGQQ